MADKRSVLIYFECAKESFIRKDYVNSAIYFRLCYLAYESSEFFVSNLATQRYGAEALRMYKMIMFSTNLSMEIQIRSKNKDGILEYLEGLF